MIIRLVVPINYYSFFLSLSLSLSLSLARSLVTADQNRSEPLWHPRSRLLKGICELTAHTHTHTHTYLVIITNRLSLRRTLCIPIITLQWCLPQQFTVFVYTTGPPPLTPLSISLSLPPPFYNIGPWELHPGAHTHPASAKVPRRVILFLLCLHGSAKIFLFSGPNAYRYWLRSLLGTT
jgi:hypothetical protein